MMRVMALENNQDSGAILPSPSGQFRHVMLAALEAPGFKAGVFDAARGSSSGFIQLDTRQLFPIFLAAMRSAELPPKCVVN